MAKSFRISRGTPIFDDDGFGAGEGDLLGMYNFDDGAWFGCLRQACSFVSSRARSAFVSDNAQDLPPGRYTLIDKAGAVMYVGKAKSVTLGLLLVACFNVLAACTWKPWGNDEKGDRGDAGGSEQEECTLKVSACRNTCYEADLGASCIECCARNGEACDEGRNYSFYSCPNVE